MAFPEVNTREGPCTHILAAAATKANSATTSFKRYTYSTDKMGEEENIARIAKSCPENISSVVEVSSCFY